MAVATQRPQTPERASLRREIGRVGLLWASHILVDVVVDEEPEAADV